MRGVNRTILVGALGNDPESRIMPNGDAVTHLSIATSESWKDKDGVKQESTEWHRVVLFRRVAEIARDYLKKGSKVYIEGKLKTRKWQDNNGVDKWTTEIIANELQFLDSKNGAQQSGPAQPAAQPAPAGTTEEDIPF